MTEVRFSSLPDQNDSSPYKDLQEEVQQELLSENGGEEEPNKRNPSLFFDDKTRKIDFVLVWDTDNDECTKEVSKNRRAIFEKNLMNQGLELEVSEPEGITLKFVKVHATWELLHRYAEIMKLRMPIKECHGAVESEPESWWLDWIPQVPGLQREAQPHRMIKHMQHLSDKVKDRLKPDINLFPEHQKPYTAIYSRAKEYLFDVHNVNFFDTSTRSRIVHFILEREKYTEKEDATDGHEVGIDRLLENSAYIAAYPLHDGSYKTEGNIRHSLYTEWASLRKLHRYQPIDHIKDYFGIKIGLYFAWLGFYTYYLIPATIVGLCCFLYGCLTLFNNEPSEDICNKSVNITMCPLCDYFCGFWELNETCLHARITYLFDNPATVFFAIFMSFWSALFLEMWKRYSSEITHRWDLTGFDSHDEHPRPGYLFRLQMVTKTKKNFVTDIEEPKVPFWRMKVPGFMLSLSAVFLLVMLALVAVMGVILYRMSMLAALNVYGDDILTSYAMLFTTATAASINLCCIFVFNRIYQHVALFLTELELPRTQTEFDDSLTLKIYLLQFVNYYASIFYIAFFKGKFVGYPGSYTRLFGFRQEECSPGGCLMELCIQLAIIMVGKQIMNTVLEMSLPIIFKYWNTLKTKVGVAEADKNVHKVQWVQDYKLVEMGQRGLFSEYLEMVLQFGFVTIFVAAFPPAPFFALLNNVLEMRLDAKKFVTYYRRPVSKRVKDIGVWYGILDSIGKFAVITNALIIAFTSNFIPRLVYQNAINPEGKLDGFLDSTLSYFEIKDFPTEYRPKENITEQFCRYPDYREPPWGENPYKKTDLFWHILAARLAFVVVFQNVVALVIIFVKWVIPDVPRVLQEKIRREAYFVSKIIIKQETLRARGLGETAEGQALPRISTPVRTPEDSDGLRNRVPVSVEEHDENPV